ncbi:MULTISPECIES: hypothetical protein [unclassified Roseateles]|uniref:hypothetical protein n=1 Tax=unclassified Roseateles TaxID=2626991 RepID=UPI000AF81E2E|nr:MULTISPECIES: hypothetical protein [unclassified Roseateles]
MERKLKPETVAALEIRNAKRMRAAKLIQGGLGFREVCKQSGVSTKVYHSVRNRLKTGGLEAVPVSVSGACPGRLMRLSVEEEEELKDALYRGAPCDFGQLDLLWSYQGVARLMDDALDGKTKLSDKAKKAYLSRWGLCFSTIGRIQQKGPAIEEVQRWLDTDAPALVREARSAGGRVHWVYLRGVVSSQCSQTNASRVQMTVSVGTASTHWLCLENATEASLLDGLAVISASVPGNPWLVLVSHLCERITLSESAIQVVAPNIRISKVLGEIVFSNPVETETVAKTSASSSEKSIQGGGYRISLLDGILTIEYQIAGVGCITSWCEDLNDAWLPATPFSVRPRPVADEPELCALLVDCLTEQIRRSSLSKSLRQALMATKSTLLKLFEWSWLRGIFRPQALEQHEFDELAKDLALGGWSRALRISERTEVHIRTATRTQLESYFNDNRSRRSISVKAVFAQDIGTNAFGRELHHVRKLLGDALNLAPTPKEFVPRASVAAVEGMVATQLRQSMAAINLIADIDSPRRVDVYPYLNAYVLANKLGRADGQTPNITPDVVGTLLFESISTLRSLAPPLISVIEEYVDAVMRKPVMLHKFSVSLATLRRCQSLESLERIVGGRITMIVGRNVNIRERDFSLNCVIDRVYSAAAIIVAFLNARRKDEIVGRSIGMYCGSLRSLDPVLGLYAADFYIEKSKKDYSTFLVSSFTVLAMSTLERLSGLARRWRSAAEVSGEPARGVCMLSEFPSLIPSSRKQPVFFNFGVSAGGGRAHDFVSDALGEEAAWSFGLHTGRRAYALIHHYRFECSTLVAIAQQFGSLSIESILTYIRDGPANTGFVRAVQYGPVASEKLRSNAEAVLAIEGELEEISKEKLIAVIGEILAGDGLRVGVFAKLVTRFRQKMIGRLENDLSSVLPSSEEVANAFLDRGHRSRPYPHGNCNAAKGRRNVGAKCRSTSGHAPVPERASISVCTSCPFHDFTTGHQQSIAIYRRDELARLEALNADSVLARAISRNIESIDAWLRIRDARFAAMGAK